MNLISLHLGLFVVLVMLGELFADNNYANKVCYKSKTCIHNGVEKCAIDSKNTPRRFLDTCDILEYNCLKGTDFKKTSVDKCASLPPLDETDGEASSKEDKSSASQ